jgi:hypothetical protein
MTIAISMKVHDGLVLAADSAGSLIGTTPGGDRIVQNIYNNAHKLNGLFKGLPVGILTWGAGSIGVASMATLHKDLRRLLSTPGSGYSIDKEQYTIEDIAKKAKRFLYDETFTKTAPASRSGFGILIAGYSSDAALSEEWEFNVRDDGSCENIHQLEPSFPTIQWRGQPDAISRLVIGFEPHLIQRALESLGAEASEIPAILGTLQEHTQAPLMHPAMPIQDAIDLVTWLAEITKMYMRFMPVSATVGGPIDVAAITRHEGFKWIRRKYYFDGKLNPA